MSRTKSACHWLTVAVLMVMALPALLRAAPVVTAPKTESKEAPKVPSAQGKITERWYLLQFQGSRAGHMWVREEEAPDALREWTTMEMSIKRGETVVSVKVESTVVEDPNGTLRSITSSMSLGAAPTVTKYEFKGDKVEVTTTTGGKSTTNTVDRPEGDWVGPIAAEKQAAKQLAAGATEIKVRTLDASLGLKPIEYTRTVDDRAAKIEVLGKVVPAVKWTSTVDIMPGVETTEYVDGEGQPLKTEINFGVMKMDLVACDKRMALSQVNPPELMASTLVEMDEPIANPRELLDAAYELTIKQGKFPVLHSTSVQRSKANTPTRAFIRIQMSRPTPAPEADFNKVEYRQANALVDKDDDVIRRLAAEATGGMTGVINNNDVAERMRQYVYDFIQNKSLGVGFASASQVARTGEGDCSEHAVLLCAMLRSANIPSRVASGLVYVDEFGGKRNVFGYHMWTQALLDIQGMRRWVDLDATISKMHPFDAAHICLDVSSLADTESLNSMVTLAPIIGQLKIKVQKLE